MIQLSDSLARENVMGGSEKRGLLLIDYAYARRFKIPRLDNPESLGSSAPE